MSLRHVVRPVAMVTTCWLALMLVVGCSSSDEPSASTTTSERVAETLPPTSDLRVVTPPDVLPSIATDLIIAALQSQGATVTRVPVTLAGDAAVALRDGRADLAVLVASDEATMQAEGASNDWVVLEPFPGDAGGGNAYPVITADVSAELGDLLEATISQTTSSTDADTLAILAREIVEDGRPAADVVQDHLVGVGLLPDRE